MPISTRGRVPVAIRLLSVPVVVVLLVGGGLIAGGLISNDFTLSMALTAAWGGIVGLACLVLVRKRREMWPALAAFAVTALVAGIYLGINTFVNDTVDEDVVTAQPADRAAPNANVLLARGTFESLAHDTSGKAELIELPDGRRFVTLTEFETDNGPDLRVYLTTPDADQGSSGDESADLGALKGNVGDQQYEVPRGADVSRLTEVVVWCRAFSVGFGAATLRDT